MNGRPLSALVLRAIVALTTKLGRPPLNREVMAAVGTRSTSTLAKSLDRLAMRGLITRDPLKVVEVAK